MIAQNPTRRRRLPADERGDPMPTTGKAKSTTRQFIKLPVDVLRLRGLTLAAKVVYAVLLDRIGTNGECWPGQRRIALDCGIGLKAAHRAIHELCRAELVEVTAGGGLTGIRPERTCRYRIKRFPIDNVPQQGTFPNRHSRRTQKGNVNVPQSTTEPKKVQNKRIRLRGSPAAAKAPDKLTQEAVALWIDIYQESRGGKPDPVSGRQVGTLLRIIHELSRGDLAVFRERLRLAAGLDGRTPPFPLDRLGELTIPNLAKHWDKLGDALRRKSNAEQPDSDPDAKYRDLR